MMTLEVTEQQLDELYDGMSSNDTPSGRKRCLIVYLRAKCYPRVVVADIARIDLNSVTHYVKRYIEGGLQGLLKDNYRSPKSQSEAHTEELKKTVRKKHTAYDQPSDSHDFRTNRCAFKTLRLPSIFKKDRYEMQVLRSDARQGAGRCQATAGAANVPR